MGLGIDHLDDTGSLCARHPQASAANLMQLAMVGSRAPAFHHDCASKLQGLLMALDELTELTEHGDPQVTRAIEAAMTASRELNGLLNINRSLTRPAARTSISFRQLVTQAAERAATRLAGELVEASVNVGVPPATHGLALAIDVAAGAGRGRTLAAESAVTEHGVELALHARLPAPSNASELLAIASFVVEREGGKLWCVAADDRVVIRLPAG